MPVQFIVTINLLPTRIIVQNYLDHKRIHFRNNHNLDVSIYAFNRLIPHIVCTDSSNELALFTKLMSMSSYSWQIDCCLLLIIRGWDSLATNVKYCINRNYIFIQQRSRCSIWEKISNVSTFLSQHTVIQRAQVQIYFWSQLQLISKRKEITMERCRKVCDRNALQ